VEVGSEASCGGSKMGR